MYPDILPPPNARPPPVSAFRFRSTDFAGTLEVISVLINDRLEPRRPSFFGYHRPTNSLLLLNDDASAYAGSLTIGSAAAIQNSQATSVSNAGFVELNVRILFRPAFSGSRVLFAAAHDTAGTVGWVPVGFYRVQP